MSRWIAIKCDRCNDTIEAPEGKEPYQIQARGMVRDLCSDCLRAHNAFMAGMKLADIWYAYNAENQLKLIATLQREQERERSKTPTEGGEK